MVDIISYCAKCKKKQKVLKPEEIITRNGKRMVRGYCSICGTRTGRFMHKEERL